VTSLKRTVVQGDILFYRLVVSGGI